MKKNAFYAQSGGVTSVINSTAAALILEASKIKAAAVEFITEVTPPDCA